MISSSRPSAILRGRSGSASSGRPRATASAAPPPSTDRMRSGSPSRPATITGIETSVRMSAASFSFTPSGNAMCW